jgi:hypothetical protein
MAKLFANGAGNFSLISRQSARFLEIIALLTDHLGNSCPHPNTNSTLWTAACSIALQQDGRATVGELAERVALSPSPCWRRVRQLEESGLISG